jgi:hypothetical protein
VGSKDDDDVMYLAQQVTSSYSRCFGKSEREFGELGRLDEE